MAPEDHCTIGPNIQISGRVSGDGDVHVSGTVEGEISLANNLYIETDGSVTAEVEAQTITVEGHLEGDVVARDLVTLVDGCTVTGTIRSPRINIEEGARFRGDIDMDVSMPDVE